jgi:uncharacterized damage-inducible protein DinB
VSPWRVVPRRSMRPRGRAHGSISSSTRRGYLGALLALPEGEWQRDREASYPSIRDTFLQLLDNNVWWFDSVPNGRQQSRKEVKGKLSAVEIQRQVRRISRVRRQLSKNLTSQGLNRTLTVRSTGGDGKPPEMKLNLRTVIWRMVEEELQHRGEMNALLWQMDADARLVQRLARGVRRSPYPPPADPT